jgi:hypothetical protein
LDSGIGATVPEGAARLKGAASNVDPGKMPKSDTLAPWGLTLTGRNCAGWRGVRAGQIRSDGDVKDRGDGISVPICAFYHGGARCEGTGRGSGGG